MRISDWSSDVCSSDLHDDEQQLGGRDVEHASASPPRTDIGQRRSVSAVGVGDGAASGVRCPSICRGAGGDASSSAMPFLKLLMPLATSPIISEKRPLPNSNRTNTPKTSQCQMLKPPIENLLAPPI